MEHLNPPENLPVVPEPVEIEPEEDVHFRDQESGDKVGTSLAAGSDEDAPAAPAPRSLQPIQPSMSEQQERPIRAPHELLDVYEAAESLRLSRATIYRLAKKQHLPCYRLPGGMRFKVAEIEGFLDRYRAGARLTRSYGDS